MSAYYTVTTSYVLPLKKKNPDELLEISKKKKTLKPTIHPKFESFAALTEDKFWVGILNDCAKGRFPKGFTFKNDLLSYRKGNKMQRLEIPSSLIEGFNSVVNFFKTVGGMMSAEDRRQLQKLEEERILEKMNDLSDASWKDIKTEKIKEILINEFICDLSTVANFNEEEKKELTTTVKKGFMLKYFNSNNIIMEEGRITQIDGLIYNDEERTYEIDKRILNIRKVSRRDVGLGIEEDVTKKKQIDFLEIWEKFLEQLQNKRGKTQSSVTYSHISESDMDSYTS